MLNRLPLAVKLLVITALAALAAIALIVSFTLWSASESAQKKLETEGTVLAERYAHEIGIEYDRGFATLKAVRGALLSVRASGKMSRPDLDRVLRDLLADHPEVLGAWAGFEPNAFDGRDTEFVNTSGTDATGRFLSYWNRGSGQVILEPLVDYNTPGVGDYYLIPHQTRSETIIEPYLYSVAGRDILMTSLAIPIVENGVFLGVLGMDIALDGIWDRLKILHPFEDGAVYLISNNGLWIGYRESDQRGKPIETAIPALAAAKTAIKTGQMADLHYLSNRLGQKVHTILHPVPVAGISTPWSLMAELPTRPIEEAVAKIRTIVLGGGVVVMLVLMGVLWGSVTFVVRRPLGRVVGVITALTEGRHDLEIAETDRQDEIGQINRALLLFQDNNRQMIDLRRRQEDSEHHSSAERRAAMQSLADGFERRIRTVAGEVASAARAMVEAAAQMEANAESSTRRALEVAAAAGQASANVGTVAGASEQLSASIQEIARQVASSASISDQAVNDAEAANQMINRLSSSALQIAEVIALIDDVAGQTNLLALNATIEAARAGDAGKGFAVVANEVKQLAGQTAKATSDIQDRVSEIRNATGEAVTAIAAIGGTISRMSGIATSIASAVEQQDSATRSIAGNVQQAASGTRNVSETIAEISTRSRESADLAAQVRGSANGMLTLAERLEREMDAFLRQIRSE